MNLGSRIAVWFGGKRGGIPSDCVEVEWLESTGNQYVNTGVEMTEVGSMYRWEIFAQSINSNIKDFHWFIGDARPFVMGGTYGDTSQYTFYPSGKYEQNGVEFSDFNKGSKYEPVIHRGTVNGNVNYTGGLVIYGRTQTSDRIEIQGGKKVFYCTIWKNEEIIRNFVPVRRTTDGLGYMCDKLTGNLYGNSGTGAFIIGPDKPANGGGYKCLSSSLKSLWRRFSRVLRNSSKEVRV